MRHTNLDEASSLANSAVRLDPGNLYFRMNAANVASGMGHYADAITILQTASKLARNRSQADLVQMRIDQLNQLQQAQAHAEKMPSDWEGRAGASRLQRSSMRGVRLSIQTRPMGRSTSSLASCARLPAAIRP